MRPEETTTFHPFVGSPTPLPPTSREGMETHLIQCREEFGPEERRAELRECWRRNEGLFDKYTHPAGRPTFTELFALCEPGTVNVIANSDIYFPAEFSHLMHGGFGPKDGECYALSRWDVKEDGTTVHHAHRDSQDVWVVFGGPHIIDAPFTMGNPGCDNALAWILKQAGFTLSNPSKTIRTYHLHNVAWRSYGEGRGMPKMHRIQPPYERVEITAL